MSTSSESALPAFDTSDFKYTQPPDPSWTFGQPIIATEQGRKWTEEEKEGWKTINAAEEDPKVMYALCISGLTPRPIAFVSTISDDGVENIAPFTWFNQVSHNPAVISVACASTPLHKDTANNIKATKEFTVNIISEPWIAQANSCSIDAPPRAGLTREPSIFVKPARVKESAFTMECENAAGAVATSLILGSIKYIHVRKAVLNERGVIDPAKLKPVGRMGDNTYVKIGDGFRILRPSCAENEEEIQKSLDASV
ncbi:hypothetical protein B0H17DRAFT_1158278 [Mycena rosella]|uniref:Flavin reductase like domain-containing protein n=1 Tax=Mycena rosella TaxID=1033263 RepID=A0AAD7DS77_MYCRO|nr:hypothetical protein B0H17DRAFT_1158278 [Mycena rosella]